MDEDSDFAMQAIEDRLLTVDFHVDDGNIIADRITTPIVMEQSPLNPY